MTEPLLRPSEQARLLAISRATLLRLCRDEGLPAVLLSAGQHRRILRFRASEVSEWIRGRRERQVRATLDGERFSRRAIP